MAAVGAGPLMIESEVWACTVCRSINSKRADRCYRCHTPREVAGVKPAEMPVTGALPVPRISTAYRSSEGRAVIATVATVLFILSTALSLWLTWTLGDLRAAGEGVTADQLLHRRLPLLIVSPATGIAALLAYAAWISRVVENLPALGVGYSRVSPTMAFFEPLIPGLNIYALPARTGEVTGKLEGSGRGHVLIAIGWFFGFTPLLAAGWIWRIGRLAESGADFLRTLGATLLGAFAFQAVGLLIGLAVIWHIEGLCRTRATTTPASQAR